MKHKAAFIDRDGSLIVEKGYLDDVKKVKFYSRSIAALKMLKEAGFKAVVVTNQSGIARGYFTEKFVKDTHGHINALLKKHGLKIDGFYYCPHHQKAVREKYRKDCSCRKPNTGMLDAAVLKFKIDLKKSVTIGDKLSDVKLGHNAGAKGILVLTGYGRKEKAKIKEKGIIPDFIARDFYSAVKWAVNADKDNMEKKK